MSETCKICKKELPSRQALNGHVRNTHDMSFVWYRFKYEKHFNECPTCNKKLDFKLVDARFRPGIQNIHCSDKCSLLGKTRGYEYFMLKYDMSKKEALQASADLTRYQFKDASPNQIGYWLNKGFSKKEARQKVSQSQDKLSEKSFIARYGEKEGARLYQEHCRRCSDRTSGKSNPRYGVTLSDKQKSKISETLKASYELHEFKESYVQRYYRGTTFATVSASEQEFSRALKKHGIEFVVQFPLVVDEEFREQDKKNINKIAYVYDFKIATHNVLIEFHGDYIHANPKFFTEDMYINYYGGRLKAKYKWLKDAYKKQYAKSKGYKVVTVWEHMNYDKAARLIKSYLEKLDENAKDQKHKAGKRSC